MSIDVSQRRRKPAGTSEGGRFAPETHPPAATDLDTATYTPPASNDTSIVQARREALKRDGWIPSTSLPAPTPPATTKKIKAWWGQAFNAYGASKDGEAVPVLPDDWSRSVREGHVSTGRAVTGRRRVSRMRYQVAGRNIRMPSKTAIRHYMRHADTNQLQVPISIDTPTGPEVGFVTLSKHPDGTWVGEATGFRGENRLYVEEATAAVMEGRNMEFNTPQALRKRAHARDIARGIQPEPVQSRWIQEWGWDEQHHVMYMSTQDGNTYGYQMRKDFSPPDECYRKPGEWFNQNIRGRMTQVEAEQCPACGCFLPDLAEHVCRVQEEAKLTRTKTQDLYYKCACGDYPVFDKTNTSAATKPATATSQPDTTSGSAGVQKTAFLNNMHQRLPQTSPAILQGATRDYAPWAYRDGAMNGDNGQIHYDGVTPSATTNLDYAHMDDWSKRIIDAATSRDDVEIAGTVTESTEGNQIRAVRVYGKTLTDGYVSAFNTAETLGIQPGHIARVTTCRTAWRGDCLCYTLTTPPTVSNTADGRAA